jgi:hypothetical protein
LCIASKKKATANKHKRGFTCVAGALNKHVTEARFRLVHATRIVGNKKLKKRVVRTNWWGYSCSQAAASASCEGAGGALGIEPVTKGGSTGAWEGQGQPL